MILRGHGSGDYAEPARPIAGLPQMARRRNSVFGNGAIRLVRLAHPRWSKRFYAILRHSAPPCYIAEINRYSSGGFRPTDPQSRFNLQHFPQFQQTSAWLVR
jgi:hypothetical protein